MNNKNHFVNRYDMLSGVRINYTLQDIIEKYQLQKEKYERRIRSGYFDPKICNHDAYCYDYCITSNKEINNRVLEMKMRR